MKKENFISLLFGTIGVLVFGFGMCMCMIPEWDAFSQGVVLGLIGLALLLLTWAVRRKMQGKPFMVLRGKTIVTILLAVLGTLILGVGMCMVMVWQGLLLPGVIVGVLGIVLLLLLIPFYKGIY